MMFRFLSKMRMLRCS
ncbi:Putative methionine--tRNA ligase gene leader peptide [Deinococcus deserti]|uniref:Putative methionine--tRNA ligase gene leader peptide n=1 Tax=Deinococcus deserti (strain DSM 17065 / CIP 109153 / LMG 22923 / VCD115) TaxID=546414 RepID=X5GXZ7_DEIDV|nr:putative methionine--tRNA ligase gene leader peptide [Deinococcus deserti VCD115]